MWVRVRGREVALAWVAGEGTIWVASFLSAALRVCGLLGFGSLDVAFMLKLWNELLNDFHFEIFENTYRGEKH